MTVAEAKRIVGNQPMNCIINMKFALSLMPWLNTAEDTKRLEACKVIIRDWKGKRK